MFELPFQIPNELSHVFVTTVLMITGIAFGIVTIIQLHDNSVYGPYLIMSLITLIPGFYGLTKIIGQDKYLRLVNEDNY